MRPPTLALFLHLLLGVAWGSNAYEGVAPEANLQFATSLYRTLAASESPRANIFFSPLGVHTVASLAYIGARGDTSREMARGLHLPPTLGNVANGFRRLLATLHADKGTLYVATRVLLSDGFNIRPAYLSIANEHFGSNVDVLDFQAPMAAETINDWAANETDGKITNIITEQMLKRMTGIAIINAVYFKGLWAQPFRTADTKNNTFYVTHEKQAEVPMMTINGSFKYKRLKSLGAQILVIPYHGERQSLVVLLPFKADGLSRLEASIELMELEAILDEITRETNVEVHLPRFRLERSTELVGAFRKLGMDQMFSSTADFSGISEQEVKVSGVLHSAFIEVNEEGTEAAAITKIVDILTSEKEDELFNANHPFLFYIRCMESNTVLFMGRFSQP